MTCTTHHHACDCREAEFKTLKAENAKLRGALNEIGKKDPHGVSREEAADMACEFVLVARKTLAASTEPSEDTKGKE